jgi:hypothetical protein
MADGTWHRAQAAAPQSVRLNQAVQPRASLWAVCSCGGEAVLDPKPWLGQGLGRHPLHALEGRLRCECGARQARLEIRGLGAAPTGSGGIYPFR